MPLSAMKVRNNYVGGCHNFGFIMMGYNCHNNGEKEMYAANFGGNDVGQSETAMLLFHGPSRVCIGITKFTARRNALGVGSFFMADKTIGSEIMLAENINGWHVNQGGEKDYNPSYFTNSFVSAALREDCPECY